MNSSSKEHWEKIYSARDVCKLGWYEETPAPSMQLLSKSSIDKDDLILDIGQVHRLLLSIWLNRASKA